MQDHSTDIPLQPINDEITANAGVKLFVLRLDLNHRDISGNKLFKLKYNLEQARRQNKDTILTFGGAFSNHIAATAAAGKEYGFKTIGIIRGDKTDELNFTLRFAKQQGMELYFVSRELYKLKEETDFWSKAKFSDSLIHKFSNSFIIPEGGANEEGIKGCEEIINYIKIPFDKICCPSGTGTTLTGLILSLTGTQYAIGFQILKAERYIYNEVKTWLYKLNCLKNNWHIEEVYHFGGYAKRSGELISFMEQFENQHHITLDFVYTGKMMYGIYDLIKQGKFKSGETIIAVHTGGLQGNAGFTK